MSGLELPFRAHWKVLPQQQRGSVLIVGLVMLLLVMLVAVAIFRMSTSHVQVVANEQFHTEAATTAHYALDLALTAGNFTDPSHLPSLTAVSLQQVAHASDTAALAVRYLSPQCQRYRYLKKNELTAKDVNGIDMPRSREDASCLGSSTPGSVTIVHTDTGGAVEDNSLCVTALWELGAQASDTQTGAEVTVMQGVEMRMEISDAEQKCAP